MKRKIYLFVMLCGLTTTSNAQPQILDEGKDTITHCSPFISNPEPLVPTYLEGVYRNIGWNANWFVSIHGGTNAFVGNPVGCGDLGNRCMPAFNASVGKWISPYIGTRISLLGFKMRNSMLKKVPFQSVHADLLYNISSHFRSNYDTPSKWDAISYLGAGVVHCKSSSLPFALSYGFIGRYRLSKRIHLSAELGGTTTVRDFDGIGEGNRLGDNILHGSLGLSVTFGQIGWKKVVDAGPYILQNDILMNDMAVLQQQKDELKKKADWEEIALVELRKIMEIEGLIDKYNLIHSNDKKVDALYPKNNYSGLNSLRERLRNRRWNGDTHNYSPIIAEGADSLSSVIKDSTDNYSDGRKNIGAPIFFFFEVGTAQLTDNSQLVNAKSIAAVMTKYDLSAKIIGAADAKTGTAGSNSSLSKSRAEYIQRLLVENGVDIKNTTLEFRGGISEYSPNEANRNTGVFLFVR